MLHHTPIVTVKFPSHAKFDKKNVPEVCFSLKNHCLIYSNKKNAPPRWTGVRWEKNTLHDVRKNIFFLNKSPAGNGPHPPYLFPSLQSQLALWLTINTFHH